MAWQEEMTELVRVMTADMAATPVNSDDSIERVIVVSAQLVNGELDFSREYVVDVPGRDIVPDPTDRDAATRDDNFVNLVCMKAAAIVERGMARRESGIVIRDNGSMVDLHYKLQAALALVKDGWQRKYDDAKLDYQSGLLEGGTAVGTAVLGPFRDIASIYYSWGSEFVPSRYYR